MKNIKAKNSILLLILLPMSILAKDYGYERVNRIHYDFDKQNTNSLGTINYETREVIIKETNRILNKKFNITYPKTIKKEFNKYNSTIVNKLYDKIKEEANIKITSLKEENIKLNKKIEKQQNLINLIFNRLNILEKTTNELKSVDKQLNKKIELRGELTLDELKQKVTDGLKQKKDKLKHDQNNNIPLTNNNKIKMLNQKPIEKDLIEDLSL